MRVGNKLIGRYEVTSLGSFPGLRIKIISATLSERGQ